MKRTAVVVSLLVFAACTSAPPVVPPSRPPVVVPVTPPPPARSANAMTPVATVAKAIAEPRIRVGIVSDQTTVTFPRVAGGYYIVSDAGAATIRRGFTMTAPVPDA